jgi:hypothetical protein
LVVTFFKKTKKMAAQQPSVKADRKISRDDVLLFLREAGGDLRLAAEMAFKAAVKSPSEFIAAMMASFSEAMGENLGALEECPQRKFIFSLVQTPSIDVIEPSFKISADSKIVACRVFTTVWREIESFFFIHNWAADHLGRHLAEICIDLNNKICGITVGDSRLLGPVYFCSCCEHKTSKSIWGFDAMVDHILRSHPMTPPVKSAGKT